jgi:hypothetical protein
MKVPIEFRNASGEITTARYARPCLRVEAFWPGGKPVSLMATIDTGSGRSMIDKTKVPAGYLPSELSVIVRSAHGHEESCYAYKTVIGSNGTPEFQINLVAMDLRRMNVDLLIGLDFLSFGVMVLDFKNPSFSTFEAYGDD